MTYKVIEAKSKMKISYAHAKIQTRVVVICGPTRYQLDHGGVSLRVRQRIYSRRRGKAYTYHCITFYIGKYEFHVHKTHLQTIQ